MDSQKHLHETMSALPACGGKEKRYPTYCPLAVSFDAGRLYDELIGLRPRFEALATAWFNLENRSRWFDVGDDDLYANAEYVKPDPSNPDERIFVPGKVPSWRGISLTHVPERPETSWGACRFRKRFDGWSWKRDLDLSCTRRLVASLPFDELSVVRVLSIPRGGFAPAHIDCYDDSLWEDDGFISISFILRDGGVPTRFMAPDGSVHDVRDPVFFFKDCAPHGIPQTKSRRLMLRINGTGDPARLLPLMRLDRAIW